MRFLPVLTMLMLVFVATASATGTKVAEVLPAGDNVVVLDINGDGILDWFSGSVRIMTSTAYRPAVAVLSDGIIKIISGVKNDTVPLPDVIKKVYWWDVSNYLFYLAETIYNETWLISSDFPGSVTNAYMIGNVTLVRAVGATTDYGVAVVNDTVVFIYAREPDAYTTYQVGDVVSDIVVHYYRGYAYVYLVVSHITYFSIIKLWWKAGYTVSKNYVNIYGYNLTGAQVAFAYRDWWFAAAANRTIVITRDLTFKKALALNDEVVKIAWGDLGSGGDPDLLILTKHYFVAWEEDMGLFLNISLPAEAKEGFILADPDRDRVPELVYTDIDGNLQFVEIPLPTVPRNWFYEIPAYRILGNDYAQYDYDADRLGVWDEFSAYKTSGLTKDTDADGLSDIDEIKQYGTDPVNNDTDGDGLTDGIEIFLKTNPLKPDTDGDGLADGAEIQFGFDPLMNDTDADGLTDYQEFQYGTSPTSVDTDHDGISDYDEIFVYKTDPTNPDTDGDGFIDSKDPDPLKPSIIKREEVRTTTQNEMVTAILMLAQFVVSLGLSVKYGGRR